MANRILRGDAVALAQVWTATPADVEVGDVFKLTINGKIGVTYTAAAATVADVTAGLTAAWNASVVAEFAEITAADAGTHVTLTADTKGTPFWLTASTTNSAAGNVTVVETTPGVEQVNEVQKIELIGDGPYTGGTFTLTWDFGSGDETTGNIAYDATAATVQAAIEALTTPVPGDVIVTGGPGPSTEWYVTFTGNFAATEINEDTVDGTNLTGGGDVVVAESTKGGGKSDEIQGGTIVATAGSYTLSFNGQTTGNIAYNATAATVQTALEGLSTIGSGNINVYGGESTTADTFNIYFVFAGTLAATNVADITIDTGALTGSATFTTHKPGGQATRNEVQLVDAGQATAGTFTLTHGGETTAAINYNALDTDVQTALVALSALSSGDVNVYAGDEKNQGTASRGGMWLVEFSGSLDDTDVAELTMATGNLTGATSPGITTVHGGGGQVDEIQSVTVYGTGGTFTLTYDSQTTAATAWNASAATLTTNLEALSTITDVTVTGSGTPADPYLVTFVDPGDEDIALMTSDASSLTGGGGKVTETTAHNAGTDEVQTVTIGSGVTGGTFTLSFQGAETGNIAYNAAASAVETALEALSTIDGVSVAGSAGGPWTVTFDVAPLDNTDVELLVADGSNLVGGSGAETLTVAETTRSAGPNHFDSARNWSGNRVPDSGDDLIVDSVDVDLLYGLRQRTTFTADAGTDTLTFADTDVAFVDDQILRLRTSDTLPAGLAVDTDYYVINIDHLAGTCQLSTSSGGGAVNITDAGTGTHTIALELNSIKITNRYTGLLGLPQRTDTDYREYRPDYLFCGMISPAASVNKTVTIGALDGAGGGRLKLDLDGYAVDVTIYDTGGSVEPGVPACLVILNHTSANLTLHEGDLGVAALAGESASFNDYTQHSGVAVFGEFTLAGDFIKHGGTFTAEQLTMSGTLLSRE